MKLGAVLLLVLSLLSAPAFPAVACTVAPTYDPYRTLERIEREDVVKHAEVIVEGVIEPDKEAGPDDGIQFLRMRVDRVWKGAVASDVVVIVGLYVKICASSPRPPLGERIRFSAPLITKRPLVVKDAFDLTLEERQRIETHEDFLLFSNLTPTSATRRLPLEDAELDGLLVQYQAETEAMRQRAESGDRAARLAYAAHLFDNNELHRALAVYEGVLKDDPANLDLLLTLAVVRAQVLPGDEPEATLAEVERRAPQTRDWQGKIVRARFAATGRLTSGWRDWSDLKPPRHCEVSEGNFDDATFDRADLSDCEFVRSSFRNASFLSADLGAAYFEDADLTGARYDCATRLPDDLDPKAAGMVNVDGRCGAPTP